MPKLNTDTNGQSAEDILNATQTAQGSGSNEEIEENDQEGLSEEEQEIIQAEKQGWRPLEEWDGNPDDWVDAKTFNQRGDKIAGIATERSRRQQKRIDMLEQQLLAINDKYAAINARERAQAKATAEAYEGRIKQLEAQKEDALNASDATAALRIDKQIKEVEGRLEAAEAVVEATTPPPANDPGTQAMPAEAREWRAKNPWWGADAEATIFANGMATFYKQNINPNGTLKETFEYIDKKVASRFPEYGSEGKKSMNRKPAGPEGGNSGMRSAGTRKNADTGGISYNDLPPEAKQICDSLVKTIKGYTREKYLAKYSAAK